MTDEKYPTATCARCGAQKPLAMLYRDPSRPDDKTPTLVCRPRLCDATPGNTLTITLTPEEAQALLALIETCEVPEDENPEAIWNTCGASSPRSRATPARPRLTTGQRGPRPRPRITAKSRATPTEEVDHGHEHPERDQEPGAAGGAAPRGAGHGG